MAKWTKKYADHLYEYRSTLEERHYQDSVSFDKMLTALAGGALGLTISYSDKIVPNPLTSTKLYLFASWILFGIALLAILVSYLFSMKAREKLISQVEEALLTQNQEKWFRSKAVDVFNWSSVVSFTTGVGCYVYFVLSNLV